MPKLKLSTDLGPKRTRSRIGIIPLAVILALGLGGCAVDPASPPGVGNQYLDTGWFGPFFITLLCAFVLFNIYRARGGRDLYIRRISGLNAIDEAVGRATEMGRPVLMVPGLGGLNAISAQALNIFAYITKIAARFANPILLCCADAAIYTVAQEQIRDVYQQEGLADRYDPDSVRFLSDRQFAFAAGVSGLITREQTAACFFLGEFFAESLIFAETANGIGAIQIASSTQITQTPFFIAACDYVLIGDEFYAASAYLTRVPVLVGSLVGQDWCKLSIIAMVIAGFATNSIQFKAVDISEEKKDAVMAPVNPPRPMEEKDTFFNHFLHPQAPKIKIDREKEPAPASADATGGG
jgi:hypothetical protein